MTDASSPEIVIKIDFDQDRENPAQIFQAMSGYISAYQDLGQLVFDSAGIKEDFSLQLDHIEVSSLKTILRPAKRMATHLVEAVFSSAKDTFNHLDGEPMIISTEERVDTCAGVMETSITSNMGNEVIDAYVDRQQLAYILNEFSEVNQLLRPSEAVIFSGNGKSSEYRLNTQMRFDGDPKKMFAGETRDYKGRQKLSVPIPINEGFGQWTFKSLETKQRFTARISHADWLERYQLGLIPAIGPKDIMDVRISYDIYCPKEGNQTKETIINAKIIEVLKIIRGTGQQYELE